MQYKMYKGACRFLPLGKDRIVVRGSRRVGIITCVLAWIQRRAYNSVPLLRL